MTQFLVSSLLTAFLTTFVCAIVMVYGASSIKRFIRPRNDHVAIQASHIGDPLRFGGIAVFFGVCIGAMSLFGLSNGAYTISLLLSSLPVLIAGALEDAGLRVSARRRLVVAIVSAGLAMALFGFWVTRSDLPGVDIVLTIAPIAMALTVLVAAGFCHALNLVDGMNGLAAINIVAAALGLATIGWGGGFGQIAVLACLITVSTLAFLLFNWPVGKLFLGDAGSYTIGHLLIWLAISLVVLDDTIAAGAVLLTLFWPIMDMLHSIIRRLIKGVPVFSPDRLHFHQIVRRGLEVLWLGCGNRRWSNPLATLVMVPFIAAPVVSGVALQHSAHVSWLVFLAFAVLYSFVHWKMISLVRLYRSKFQGGPRYDLSKQSGRA